MSLALQTFAFRQFPRPVNRGGRPPVSACPIQRRRHIKAAYYRLIERRSRAWVARRFDVDVKTITAWVKLVRGYDDLEAVGLRRRLAALGVNF